MNYCEQIGTTAIKSKPLLWRINMCKKRKKQNWVQAVLFIVITVIIPIYLAHITWLWLRTIR